MANPKLDRYQVAKIKRDIQRGVPLVRIADRMSVSYITVVRIKSGANWPDVAAHELSPTFYIDHGNGPEQRTRGGGHKPRTDVFMNLDESNFLPFSDEAYEAMQGIDSWGAIGEPLEGGRVRWFTIFFDENDKKREVDISAGVRDLQSRYRLGRNSEYRTADGKYVIKQDNEEEMSSLIKAMDVYYSRLEQLEKESA